MKSSEIKIKTKDGTDISAMLYNPDENAKAVVVLSHGFGEHSGSYKEIIERFNQANYACVIFDQRGHGSFSGKSPEERSKLLGVILNYQDFLDDIYIILGEIKQKMPDIPVILYGHSMGGNIVANYLLTHDQSNQSNQSDISCAVLESPWLGLYKELNPFVVFIAKILGNISPNFTIINKLPASDVTGDPEKVKDYDDPLYHNRISFRMFSGIKKACTYVINNASKLNIPIYLAYAKNEKIVSNPAIQKFIKTSGKNVTVKEYESCHAIHNDVVREEYYRDVIAYLDKNCSSVYNNYNKS